MAALNRSNYEITNNLQMPLNCIKRGKSVRKLVKKNKKQINSGDEDSDQ